MVNQGIFTSLPDQVIVNEYEPGQGISAHVDCMPCFGGTIASLSLLSSCHMQFTPAKNERPIPFSENGAKIEADLKPRSLLVLTGSSRTDWCHAIPARKSDPAPGGIRVARTRRISLTFRTVVLSNSLALSQIVPAADGTTHINVYSKGATELGRFLSNFAHAPFVCEDGDFASVEGHWYWLGVPETEPQRVVLRHEYGASAKALGRKLRARDWHEDDEEFKRKIRLAITQKLRANPKMAASLRDNGLPLTHYYYFGEKGNAKIVEPADGQWIIQWMETLADYLRTLEASNHQGVKALAAGEHLEGV